MKRNTDALLAFIFDRIGEIAKLNDNKKVLYALAKMGRDIVYADRCTIWILDHEKKTLWTEVAHGVGKLTVEPFSGIVGAAIESGESLIVNDVYADSRFNSSVDGETGYKTETMMVIPMKNRHGLVTGAIQVINKKDKGTFEEEDLKYLRLASTYVGETMRAMLLIEEIDATQKELIHIMSVVGESRSQETGKHVKRVAAYAKMLAELYGMDEEEASLLSEASPMHDIGKIAIPDAILNKTGALTREEWEVMKTHSRLGYDMLKGSSRKLLQAAAIVAHEHHEKYDGSGYPRGIMGEAIHIYGRIVSIVDVLDALGSKRSYKKAWSNEEIFAYLLEEKGKHFDPNLVDLLLAHKDRFMGLREEYEDDASDKENEITVLGAYGSKSKECGSSALKLNGKNVLDAGNLLVGLRGQSEEMETVWLSHSHLDHIVDLAYVLDNDFERRVVPLKIMALPETIDALKKHFFNDVIWPDFSRIPLMGGGPMVLEYEALHIGRRYKLEEGKAIEAFAGDHSVPCVGYVIHAREESLLVCTDTYSLEHVVRTIEDNIKIRTCIIECSFPARLSQLARDSKHLTAEHLFEGLSTLEKKGIKLYINHIKPAYKQEIISEIEMCKGDWDVEILQDGSVIRF